MGGHAFHYLYCPRMSPALYLKVREQTTDALRKLFKHVVVPTELPSKPDYGDVDFLVAGFLQASPTTTTAALDWPTMVSKTKDAFNTVHGRRGHLTPSVMYFAIPAPGPENDFWVQVDVKVCEEATKEAFEWMRFKLNYASAAKMIGSLIKPLGLNINPEGLHIRVEEVEEANVPGSMVLVTKDARDVLKIVGLDRRILHAGFATKEELYEYLASSWLFNPAHFAKRLEDAKYVAHLEERAPPWVPFVTQWIPQHYPGYRFGDQDLPIEAWYKATRAAVKEKVFTLFPSIAPEFYTKRATNLAQVEEQRLRELLIQAIPAGQDGWADDDVPQPHNIIVKSQSPIPTTPELKPTLPNDPASPISPTGSSCTTLVNSPSSSASSPPPSLSDHPSNDYLPANPPSPRDVPLYLDALPRAPPLACTPRPPPASMSLDAKLLCVFRWTLFHPDTGAPFLAAEPREKGFEMRWMDSGAGDKVLVEWVREVWWAVWVRQSWVNYVGMWKRRFEKEDRKKEREKEKMQEEGVERAEAKRREEEVLARKEKILGRLKVMNEGMGCALEG